MQKTEKIKDKAARLKLKTFLESYFDFSNLKEAGFFQCSKNDYEARAAKICYFFGYKTVYEYAATICKLRDCGGRYCDVNNRGCRKYNSKMQPQRLEIDYCELVTNDKYLN